MNAAEKVVIVTGAASGIGAATARRIAGPATGLVIHTRKNAAGLDTLRADLEAAGSEVATILGDLAEPDTAGAIVALARDTFGGVDQIVSNAGQAQRGGFGTEFSLSRVQEGYSLFEGQHVQPD